MDTYTLPPCTTKRRTTTHLKTKINQNCQKIELNGSPAMKELKKKPFIQTGRRNWLEDLAVPHLHVDKVGGTTGERDRPCNPEFQPREIKPQNLWLKKPVGVAAVGETPSLTGEFVGETHRVLECTQTHPPGNQHQKGPICLWVVGEVTKSSTKTQASSTVPSQTPLPHTVPQCSNVGCPNLAST